MRARVRAHTHTHTQFAKNCLHQQITWWWPNFKTIIRKLMIYHQCNSSEQASSKTWTHTDNPISVSITTRLLPRFTSRDKWQINITSVFAQYPSTQNIYQIKCGDYYCWNVKLTWQMAVCHYVKSDQWINNNMPKHLKILNLAMPPLVHFDTRSHKNLYTTKEKQTQLHFNG